MPRPPGRMGGGPPRRRSRARCRRRGGERTRRRGHGGRGLAPQGPLYDCYQGGVGLTTYYNGVSVIIKDRSHYTTRGAHFTGTYRYVHRGRKVVFLSGELRGLKSRYETGHGGQAIYITFKDGTARNTAVCGRAH